MALLCEEVELRGKKPVQIWCKHTGQPCAYLRYCAVSRKYYQTDKAKDCKLREARP